MTGKISNGIFCVFLLLSFAGCERDKNHENTIEQGFEEVKGYSPDTLQINAILVDPSGDKWIGTDSGLFKLNDDKWFAYIAQKNVSVKSLTNAGDVIYIASSSGAATMEFINNKPEITHTFNQLNPGFSFGPVNSFGQGFGGRQWFGIPEGLVMSDGLRFLKNKNIYLGFSGIWAVNSMTFRYNQGFFGTNGSFLYHVKYNPETDAITGASQMKGGAENPEYNYNGELTTDTIFCVLASADSSIWFGSTQGLTRNKGETKVGNGLFEYHLRNERVRCLYEYSDGMILAGTESGLYVKKASGWTLYTVDNGLPGNVVLSLCEDLNGTLWVGTDKGVGRIILE